MRNWAQFLCANLFLLLIVLSAGPAVAQAVPYAAPTSGISVQTLAPINNPTNFNPDRAVESYLRQVSGKERANSDAYFEGRYWLSFIRVLYALIVAAGLLWLRISSAMREIAERITRKRFWQVSIYAVQYIVLMTLLTFPLTAYQNYARERIFELTNQSLAGWMGTFALSTAFTVILGTIFFTLLYWVIRKAREVWWLWGTGFSILFITVWLAILPNIVPVFVESTPLPSGEVKAQIQDLARANGRSGDLILVAKTSERSNRINASVVGFGSTAPIYITDTLLKQGSEREIKIAIAQEIGHAVLNHTLTGIVLFSLILFVGFAVMHYSFLLLTGLFGGSWDVRRLDDPAGLPVMIAVGTLYFLLASPFTNWIGRAHERQADLFALNAAREPDALATLVLKQSAFIKLEPGSLEEALFYNQPSGKSRIEMAMRWKAAHLKDQDIASGPISPQ